MFVFDVVGFNFRSRVILIGQVLYLGTSGEILINFIRSSFDDQLCLGTAGFDARLSLGTPGETLLLAAGSKVQLEPHFLQVR